MKEFLTERELTEEEQYECAAANMAAENERNKEHEHTQQRREENA